MTTYVGLLGGINVSGQKLMKMKDLQLALGGSGLLDVRTYIQSGNFVFRSRSRSASALSKTVREAIAERFDYDVPTLVISAQELRVIAAANPYENDAEKDPARTFVMFFVGTPEAKNIASLPAAPADKITFHVGARAVYAHYPEGYGTTKMDKNFFEKRLGIPMTARNLRTVRVLMEMTED